MTIFDPLGYADSVPRDRIAVLKSAERIPGGAFSSLPFEQRKAAEAWLWKFCQKWGEDLPSWRYAILVGVAKRLAVNPPAPKFGLRLLRARSGHGTTRKFRALGIPLPGIVAMHRRWDRRTEPLPSKQIAL